MYPFSAKQGQITAIVGPSGGGKSTIANLISRFWDVSSGSITIGGVDVRDVAEDDLIAPSQLCVSGYFPVQAEHPG